jgi:hypothetical protein
MYVCNYRGVGLFYRCGGWSGKSPQFAWMSHVSPGHVCPVVGPASARIADSRLGLRFAPVCESGHPWTRDPLACAAKQGVSGHDVRRKRHEF